MTRKLNAIAAAVLALGVVSAAQALTIVGNSPTTLASEFLSSAGTTTVKLNNIGFNSTSQGIVAGNNYTIKLTLSAGKWSSTMPNAAFFHQDPSQPAPNAQQFKIVSGAGTNVLTLAPIGVAIAVATPAAAANANFAGNSTLPAAVAAAVAPAVFSSTAANTLFQFNGASVDVTAADLIASGTNDDGCTIAFKSLAVTGQYFDNNGNEVDFANGTLNTATIISAGQGIVGAIAAPATAPVIDVRTSGGKKFVTSGGAVVTSAAIGTYSFSAAPGTQSDNITVAPANPDYNATNAAWTDNGQTVNLISSAGLASNASFSIMQFAAVPAGQVYVSGGTCDSPAMIASLAGVPQAPAAAIANFAVPAASTTISGNNVTLAIAAATAGVTDAATSGKNLTICYNVVGAAADTVIPQSKFTGYAVSKRAAGATVLNDTAAGALCPANLASLTLNSGLIKIRNYSPVSVNQYGWNQFTRIINSGATTTPVTAYYQYADGTVSTVKTLVASLPAGGNVTLLNTEVEAMLGAPSVILGSNGKASNPRLVILGSSDSLRVQNYQMTPDSQRWMEVSGGQSDTNTDNSALFLK